MIRHIHYFFSILSPWAYLGHDLFIKISKEYHARIEWRPVNLLEVFKASGTPPLSQRPVSRQAYRLIELQRWREARGLPLNLHPKFWPFAASLADRMTIAFVELGHDPAVFAGECMKAVWAKDQDVSKEDVLIDIAQSCNLPAQDGLKLAENEAIAKLYQTYTEEAIDLGAFGAPNYYLNGELFWGQDRLELLAQALQSGRAPFHAEL